MFRYDGSSWVEEKFAASDGTAYGLLGWSASVSGDTILVGSVRDDDNGSNSGSAYIYIPQSAP